MTSEKNLKVEGRRPLKVRKAALAKNFAKWLGQQNVTPNQISLLSVCFAGCAAFCFLAIPKSSPRINLIYLVLAPVFIQCRLLCNLFDGMVAVEGGKGTRSGELFNDLPDRIADPLILVSTGYAINILPWAHILGWFSAILALLTAYIRTLSVSIGAPPCFLGPMAKQHRMATITIASLLSAFEDYFFGRSYSLFIALVIIIIGCFITMYRRLITAYNYLENKK